MQTYFSKIVSIFNSYEDWIINNGRGSTFSTCNSQTIFGGFNNFGVDTSVTRFFGNLDSHYEMKIEMEFWRIDRWGFDQLKIIVDDDLQFQKTYRTMGSTPDYCGGGGYDDQYELISLRFPHKRKTAWVYIYVSYNTDFNQSWGFRTFKMSIEQCPQGCGMCSSNDYPQCLRWHYQESFFSQQLILGQEQWNGEGFPLSQYQSIQCANCNYKQGMKFHREIGLVNHLDMRLRFYRQDTNNIRVSSIGGQNYIMYYQNRFVEFEILGKDGGISQISLESLQQELQIRDIELYYAESENYDIIPFHPGCDQFINSKCISCMDGWIYNQKEEKCYSDCGDRVIQFLEECDDGNQIPYDGCFECKFQCDVNCQTCKFGKCITCKSEFQLDNLNICQPICGDFIVVPYSTETCDDGNSVQFDGCFNCNIECNELCQICHHELCLKCKLGYILKEGICVSYCGDEIIISDEECDDGNLIPFDGCFECKYQCIEGCHICLQGECLLRCGVGFQFQVDRCISLCGDLIVTSEEQCDDGNTIPFDGCFECQIQCQLGYEYINQQCVPICGDRITSNNEDCDDGNSIEFDGCHLCKYSCPLNCQICYQGQCILCDNHYELIDSGQCQIQIQINDQQCNDLNDFPIDGCYNSQIEQNWVCQTIAQISECAYSLNPQVIVTYLNMASNIQYVKISFNQEVKILSDILLSQSIKTQILEISSDDQNINLQIIYEAGHQIAYVEYILEIEIFKLLDFKPKLEITLNQQVVNINEVAINPNSYFLTLQNPTYLDKLQSDLAQRLLQINKSVIYSLGAIGFMSLLLGFSSIFFDILTVLQYYSYLRYINLEFPSNLMIYFEIGDILSMQPLLDFIHFQDILNCFSVDQSFQQSYGKFLFYELNADLLQNTQTQMFQFLMIGLLFMVPLYSIKKIVFYKIFTQSFFDRISCKQLQKKDCVFKFYKTFYTFMKRLISWDDLLTYHGFRQILIVNGWDLIFKTLLFIQSSNTLNFKDIIQIILASLILFTYFLIIIQSCNQSQSKNQRLINLLLGERFQIFNLIRIIYFFVVLIFFQREKIIQIILISSSCLFSLTLIFCYRKTFKNTNLIVQLIVEIIVFIFTLTSIIYIEEFSIGEELKIIFGWFHIATLSIGTVVQFLVIIYEKVKKAYNIENLSDSKQKQNKNNSHLILHEASKRIVMQQF
ncbi:unnamed protein product [Paramecium octaurelia]|uniref:Uncharacterized protein n=1 Tax=Paramecium octaurelia TaxID=43137 RepID=A0A8S1T6E1_PAROT|nr:unnamed protein product [Paramecium octaurelia]